jgi:hypothetical protein
MPNSKKINLKWAFALWLWIGIWAFALLYAYFVYDPGKLFLWIILALPLWIVLFFTPLFTLLDKANFPFKIILPFTINKLRYQTLLLGILMIPAGLIYYFEEWDYKYRVHVPSDTGVLFVIVGIIFIIFSVFQKRNS